MKRPVMYYLHKGFNHIITQISILVLAVFVLFSGDLEIVIIPHQFHYIIINIRNFCFIFFCIEFILSILVEDGFLLSLYMFMDFIDLISLAIEVSFIFNALISSLDNLSRSSNPMTEFILSRSSQTSPGIGVDSDTVKYLAFFKVISYLKIMRVAKVIEATKRINITVSKRKKDKRKSIKVFENAKQGIKTRKDIKNMKTDIHLAVKYFSEFEKFKEDLKLRKRKQSNKNQNERSPNGRITRRIKSNTVKASPIKANILIQKNYNKIGTMNFRLNSSIFNASPSKNPIALKPADLFTKSFQNSKTIRSPYKSVSYKDNKYQTETSKISDIVRHKLSNSDNRNSNVKFRASATLKLSNNNMAIKAMSEQIIPIVSKKNLLGNSQSENDSSFKISAVDSLKQDKSKKSLKSLKLEETENIEKSDKENNNFGLIKNNSSSIRKDFIKKVLFNPQSQNKSNSNKKVSYEVNPVVSSINQPKSIIKKTTAISNISNEKQFNYAESRRESFGIEYNTLFPKERIISNEIEISDFDLNDNADIKKKIIIQKVEVQNTKHQSHFLNRAKAFIPETVKEVESEHNYSIDEAKLEKETKVKESYQSKFKKTPLKKLKSQMLIKRFTSRISKRNKSADDANSQKRDHIETFNILLASLEENIVDKNKINTKTMNLNIIKSRNPSNYSNAESDQEESYSEAKHTFSSMADVSKSHNNKNIIDSNYQVKKVEDISKSPNKTSKLSNSYKTSSFEDEEDDIDDNYPVQTIRKNLITYSEHSDEDKKHSFNQTYLSNSISNIENTNDDSYEEIDYNKVQGLNDTLIDNLHKKRKRSNGKEKLILEKILFKNMTLKIIMLIMLIIIGLQLTQDSFVEAFIVSDNTDKVGHCLNTMIKEIKYLNNGNNGNSTSDVFEEKDYLNALNITLKSCFSNLKLIDNSHNLGDIANTHRLLAESENITESPEQDNTFLMINMTNCVECVNIKNKYPDIFTIDLEIASDDYFNSHGLITNIDYSYRYYALNNTKGHESYIEYLIFIYYQSFIDRVMNIFRSVFITIILVILSTQLGMDIRNKIIKPAIKIIKKFRYFFHMDTFSFYNLLIDKEIEEEEIILYKKLGLFSYYFDLTVGKRILGLISQSHNLTNNIENYNLKTKGISIAGTAIILNVEFQSSENNDKVVNELNAFYTVFHSLAYAYLGEIINENIIIWKKKETDFNFEHDEYCKAISKRIKFYYYHSQQ